MTITCRQCNAQNADAASFCSRCGSKLNDAVGISPWASVREINQAQSTSPEIKASDQNTVAVQTKKISLALFIGILFVPYIFSWFTLRKGFSNTVRGISFAWMLLVFVLVVRDKGRPQPAPALNSVSATPSTPATPTPLPLAELLAQTKVLLKRDNVAHQEIGRMLDQLNAVPKEAKEYKETQSIIKPARERWARLAAEELVLGSKPENSKWDGSVLCVDKYLKATLNDYDSAEYVEWSPVTRIDLKGEPYWTVRLKLRAKNAFGGKILKEAIFFIRQNQVVNVIGL